MSQIGPYRIEGELGRGSMGVVYRGIDPVIGRTVAIKTIRLSNLADSLERSALEDRFLREARSAGILTHPNIVTVYHVGQEGDFAYIAMEFVNGPTLGQVMAATKKVASEKILEILRQTAAALDYAHHRGVIHRDVKPANIMLQENGAVKITDFGVAKLSSQSLTKTGMSVGTPSYMPAEQIQGKPVDGRADQYALAVVAYELLTAARPFDADTLTTLLFKVVYEQPTAPHAVNPDLSPALEPVFRRALSKEPTARFESCAEFVKQFEKAFLAKPSAPRKPPLLQRFSPVRRIAFAAGLGGILIAAAGVYAFVNASRDPERASVQGPVSTPATEMAPKAAPSNPLEDRPAAPAAPSPLETVTVTGIPKPLPVPSGEQAKKLIRKVNPVYPPLAQTARIEGEVFVSLLIGRDGTVKKAEALHGHPYLIPAALKAASQWIYEPTKVNGIPVEVETDVAVLFKLKRN
jgi:serine/threonine-protein kinase